MRKSWLNNKTIVISGASGGLGFAIAKLLIEKFNGCYETILTYAGFGDILLTCTSVKSRNYRYGQTLASNNSDEKKEFESSNTIEGKNALNALYKINKEKNMDIKILDVLYSIVFENKDVNLLLDFLMI